MEKSSKKLSLGKETFFLFIGRASESIFGLLAGMVLVRHFVDKNIFATYSQSIFLAQTLLAFAPLGLHRAIMFFLPRVKSKRAFVIQTTILTSFFICIFGGLLIYLREQISSWLNNPQLACTVPVIFGILWTMNFHSILLQVLIGTKRAKVAGIVLTAVSTCNLLFIVAGSYLDYDVYQMLLLVLGLNAAKATVCLCYVFRLPGQLRQVCNMSNIPRQIRYALPLGLSSFTSMIGKTIDRFLVMSIFRPNVFAVYDRGAITIPFVEQVSYSIFGVLQPHLIELYQNKDIEGFIQAWHEALLKCAKIILPIMAFSWVVADYLIVVVNTSAYVGSVKYFRIYLFLLPLNLTIYSSVLMAIGHTGKVFGVSSLYFACNISMSIVLVKAFEMGPMGPAIATVISELIRSILYLYAISKSLRTKLRDVYPWIRLLGISVISVLSGGIIYPMSRIEVSFFTHQPIDLNKLFTLAVLCSMYIAVYIVLALSFRIITWKEITADRRMMATG